VSPATAPSRHHVSRHAGESSTNNIKRTIVEKILANFADL